MSIGRDDLRTLGAEICKYRVVFNDNSIETEKIIYAKGYYLKDGFFWFGRYQEPDHFSGGYSDIIAASEVSSIGCDVMLTYGEAAEEQKKAEAA